MIRHNQKPSLLQKTQQFISPMRKVIIYGTLAFALFAAWLIFTGGDSFQTSLLQSTSPDSNQSLSRLSSAVFSFTIDPPGQLKFSSSPSAFSSEDTLLALVLESNQASLSTWQLNSSFSTIINQANPANPKQHQLLFSLPKGFFTQEDQAIGTLPFTTTNEGKFTIRALRLASIPFKGFPASQNTPIFIDSFKSIEFDSQGALKKLGPTPSPTPEPPPAAPVPAAPPKAVERLPLSLNLPSGILSANNTITLPPAQQGLQYLYQLKTSNGTGQAQYGLLSSTPATDGSYLLGSSGIRLKSSGGLLGEPSSLVPGNYRFKAFVRDEKDIIEITLILAVYDKFGQPVGLVLNTTFSDNTQTCLLNEVCEAFFTASKGVEPYTFALSGEQPVSGAFLTPNNNEAFYRFNPTKTGQFQFRITVIDDLKNTASNDITLNISAPEIDSSFKYSAEPSCDFLDLNSSNTYYQAFQFTCRNQIMRGFEGNIRATDSLNRAEAAKVTSLIVSDQGTVADTFSPFTGVNPSSLVNYNDVTVGDWYGQYVYYLFRKGIIIDNTLYRPGDTLNAAEAMKLIFESFGELNTKIFDDLETIPKGEWFEAYQTLAAFIGATIGTVDPALPAQRAWIADLLLKLQQKYPNGKFK